MQPDILEKILDKGRFAPSADNLQPWIFKISNHAVHFWLDDSRLNSYCDAGYLAPYISAGAVIENIRVAASHYGYEIEVQYLPILDEPRRVADIKFMKCNCIESSHFGYIEKRHTNRNFYKKGHSVDQIVYQRLEKQIPQDSNFQLLWHSRDDSDYKNLADVIGQADQMRFEIKRLHQELMNIVRFSHDEEETTRDGLTLPSMEVKGPSAWIFRLIKSWKWLKVLNRIGLSFSFNLYARKQILSSQNCGLFLAKDKSPKSFIQGGEIFQRIWHEASLNDLALQPMEALPIFIINHEITNGADLNLHQKQKLAQLKENFFRLYRINNDHGLIFLFRTGAAAPVSGRSYRRPIKDFIQYQNEKVGTPCP